VNDRMAERLHYPEITRDAMRSLPMLRTYTERDRLPLFMPWLRRGCRLAEAPITLAEPRHRGSNLNRGTLLESVQLPRRVALRTDAPETSPSGPASQPRVPWC